MGPQCGHTDTGSPGTQLREVRLSAPGCPSGEGRELGEQEGLRGGEKEVSVRISLPGSNCYHVPLLLKNPQWRPVASRPNSSAQPSRPPTFWAPHTYPILTLPLKKTRLPVLVRLILLLTGDGTIPL